MEKHTHKEAEAEKEKEKDNYYNFTRFSYSTKYCSLKPTQETY